MSAFAFVGRVPASKSMLNRALLIQSYAPSLTLEGDSSCDDVRHMRQALEDLHQGREIFVGSAGTVLRFMAFRASRVPGRHVLKGEPRLFARPQAELTRVLGQLGVQASLFEDRLEIEGDGWKLHGDTLLVPSDRSSQFATGVLLNAWDLPFDLYVSLGQGKVSEGYWRMSVQMAQAVGMRLDFWDADFRVPRDQKATAETLTSEIDMSSAFALAAIAAVSGTASLLDFPESSLQPDSVFVPILKSMGVPISRSGRTLKVDRASRLTGVAVNLGNAPDLFPVLAILAALSEGESDLYGAPQLAHKESNRLQHMATWIERLGRQVEVRHDGLKIKGLEPIRPGAEVLFDSDQDHRLAFAAAVLKAAGFPVRLNDASVVTKSFPEFWSVAGWTL